MLGVYCYSLLKDAHLGFFFIGWKMSSALFSWILYLFLYCLCCKYNKDITGIQLFCIFIKI